MLSTWIFAKLPGPLWLRWIQAVLLVAVVAGLLLEVVYPWIGDAVSLFDDTPFEDDA